jgi:hypothetical protein
MTMATSLLTRRLVGLRVAAHARTHATPAALVKWLGAVQAQDYGASKWAVGLRLASATDDLVERALSEGTILRTHAFRGTWQLITPADMRWMLALVAPRVMREGRRYRELGLDAKTFTRSQTLLAKALRAGRHATRDELADALEKGGVRTDGQRMAYLLQRAEVDQVIASGARRGKQITYALFSDRVPSSKTETTREESIAELAHRYFRSRGPATLSDFVWWSGLGTRDARSGLEANERRLVSEVIDGETYFYQDESDVESEPSPAAHLLPAFDEYLVSYRGRLNLIDARYTKKVNAGGGMLKPCVVVDGVVRGLWSRTFQGRTVRIALMMFERTKPREARAIRSAAEEYASFVGAEKVVVGDD